MNIFFTSRATLVAAFQLALAQTTIGLSIVIAKYLLNVLPIYVFLTLRFLLSTFFMLICVYYYREKIYQNKNGISLSRRDWTILFVQALLGGFIFNVLINNGLNYTSANMAGIIQATVPAVIAFLSFLLLKEKLTKQKIIGISLAILGLITLSMNSGKVDWQANHFIGNLLVLLAVLPESLFTIVAKWYGNQITPTVMAFIVCAFNALLFLPLAIWQSSNFDLTSISMLSWLLLALHGLGAAAFFVFWYRGLEHHTASTAALITTFMPISTTILAYIFLGEQLTTIQFCAMVLVIGSIVFGATTYKRRTQVVRAMNND